MLACLRELAQGGTVALRGDVAELLTPVLGCCLTDVQARHDPVDRARHIESDGPRLHQVFETCSDITLPSGLAFAASNPTSLKLNACAAGTF